MSPLSKTELQGVTLLCNVISNANRKNLMAELILNSFLTVGLKAGDPHAVASHIVDTVELFKYVVNFSFVNINVRCRYS